MHRNEEGIKKGGGGRKDDGERERTHESSDWASHLQDT